MSPRKKTLELPQKRPVGIDLFAGAGGLSLGFEQAGFDIAAAVEIDPVHAAAHHYNFPECTTICGSVADLTAKEIREKANLGKEPVDVVFGGAPCQGFSLIGHRVLDDPRNSLVRDFVRLVVGLKARYFVFENVKGLTVGRHQQVLRELIEVFQEEGYSVRIPWKVLNAAHYGVPQHRERLFLLGARRGQCLPEYPAERTSQAGKRSQDDQVETGPTCRDALGDLPDAEGFNELWGADSVRTKLWGPPSAYARVLRCLDGPAWFHGHKRKWDESALSSSARTRHTKISRRRFATTAPGVVEPISRFLRLHPEGVSNTLRAGTDSARGAFTSPRPIHYSLARCITVREMARLHGFPDWFRFHATKWHGARQVGNSVPPPLGRAVAQELIRAMGIKARRSKKTTVLGDSELLRMDMSRAAEHWDVPVRIAGRDRKSGATKRKQAEIEALQGRV